MFGKLDEIESSGLGCHKWLIAHIETQGKEEYASYYDGTYPMETGIGYITERDLVSLPAETGTPFCLRLIQLALHTMSGNAGLVETPTMRTLVVKILEQGFLTDANKEQGVEMLASRPMIKNVDNMEATDYSMKYG